MAKRAEKKAKTGGQDVQQGKQNALPTREAFDRLRRRANDGDEDARAELRWLFDAHPEIWHRMGDLAAHAEENLIRLIAEGEFVLSEAIRRRAAQLRQDLLGPFPTPLERLAVERVVATWLYMEHVETQVAKGEVEEGPVRLWLKRQEQAHKLHQAAVKALVTIRELLPSDGVVDATPTRENTRPNGTVDRIATAAARLKRQRVLA